MKTMRKSKAFQFSIFLVVCQSINSVYGQAVFSTGDFRIPEHARQFYSTNQSFILSLLAVAEDPTQASDARLEALQKLESRFSFALIEPAIRLTSDPNVQVAVEAVNFLASTLVGHSLPKLGNDPSFPTVEALRRAAISDREEIRRAAAPVLASLNDDVTIKAIEQLYEKGNIPDVEATRYMTLASPPLASSYLAEILGKGSLKARLDAIAYLGSVPQYQPRVQSDYLQNKAAPPELRAAAAQVLAKNDRRFSQYAPDLASDQSLPRNVIAEISKNTGTMKSEGCLGPGCSLGDEFGQMSFFVTSVGLGKGGDLGGLVGADAHCQTLASLPQHQRVRRSNKCEGPDWHRSLEKR
jgi:hypothetical protein